MLGLLEFGAGAEGPEEVVHPCGGWGGYWLPSVVRLFGMGWIS